MKSKVKTKIPGSGRKKGSKNKRSLELRERAERLGVDPFEILLYFAKGDWKALGYDAEVVVKFSSTGIRNEEFVIDPAVRARAAAEALQYLEPKKKMIEHTTANGDGIASPVIFLPPNSREQKD